MRYGPRAVPGRRSQTLVEQWCRGCPDRLIQDDAGGILAEQRLNLVPQRLVARARVGEKRVPRGRILVDGQLVDSGDVLPALGSQRSPWSPCDRECKECEGR